MLFRRNKIKENPKRLPFRGKQQSHNTSGWDNLSFIEQIALLGLPCMLGFIFYMMLDVIGLIWWLKIIISVIMVGGCIGLITLIVNLIMKEY